MFSSHSLMRVWHLRVIYAFESRLVVVKQFCAHQDELLMHQFAHLYTQFMQETGNHSAGAL